MVYLIVSLFSFRATIQSDVMTIRKRVMHDVTMCMVTENRGTVTYLRESPQNLRLCLAVRLCGIGLHHHAILSRVDCTVVELATS